MNKVIRQLFIFFGSGMILGYITYVMLLQLRGIQKFEFLGWLNLIGWGVLPGVVTLGAVMIVVTADIIWLYALFVWLLQQKFHLKPDDNTLNLP